MGTLHNRRAGNYSNAAHNYSIVNNLAQSPTAMSTLEVLQSCPKQQKSLLSALGVVDPADTCMMAFDLDKATPRIPSNVAFQIPISVQNITIHQCVIDEGASTCIISKNVCQKLGALEPKLLSSHSKHTIVDPRAPLVPSKMY